jgi:hypothetical protein
VKLRFRGELLQLLRSHSDGQMKPSSSRPGATTIPGDILYLVVDGQVFLSRKQIADYVWSMLIRPRGLDHNSSEVRVAGFSYAPMLHPIPRRVFTGNQVSFSRES